MRYYAYVRVEGESFDPDKLNHDIQGKLQGSIAQRKHSGAPIGKVPLRFWKSKEQILDPKHPESDLKILLKNFKAAIDNVSLDKSAYINVEFVVQYSEFEEPRGFFFDAETLKLLADIGAQLDIDAVPIVTNDNLASHDSGST